MFRHVNSRGMHRNFYTPNRKQLSLFNLQQVYFLVIKTDFFLFNYLLLNEKYGKKLPPHSARIQPISYFSQSELELTMPESHQN